MLKGAKIENNKDKHPQMVDKCDCNYQMNHNYSGVFYNDIENKNK